MFLTQCIEKKSNFFQIEDATKTLSDNILTLGNAHHGAYLNADLTVIPN